MATIGHVLDGEGGGRARAISWSVLGEAATWFAAAVAGMLIVFAGLIVDAYRHNHGAEEESLLSLSNPGHLLVAVGLGITSAAVLAGLTAALMKTASTKEDVMRRIVPVTVSWAGTATLAVAAVVYIASSGVTVGHSHNDGDVSAVSDVAGASTHTDHAADGGEEAGLVTALEGEGIDPDGVDGALTQGVDGQNGSAHDHGKHPTFTQLETMSDTELLPLFPDGTLSDGDLPVLKQQVGQVRAVALKFPTVESATAAGYVNTTSDVPFMGQHFINFDLLKDGKFDPTQPEGLLFSKIDDGPEKLVGVWFLQLPGIGGVTRETEPAGFAGDLDLWHAHVGLCLVGLSGASEGQTRESCDAKGGRFTADLRWMMHVWVAPESTENPDGFFAYLNGDLFDKQTAAKDGGADPSGVVR